MFHALNISKMYPKHEIKYVLENIGIQILKIESFYNIHKKIECNRIYFDTKNFNILIDNMYMIPPKFINQVKNFN